MLQSYMHSKTSMALVILADPKIEKSSSYVQSKNIISVITIQAQVILMLSVQQESEARFIFLLSWICGGGTV